jgi:hypothetical protein
LDFILDRVELNRFAVVYWGSIEMLPFFNCCSDI